MVSSAGSKEEVTVVGAGPNGLAAAIEMARAGYRVSVLEAADTIGGGARTQELTLPGFLHDTCSAIHPLGVASPFMNQLPLGRYGLRWIFPPASLAHPFDDGTAAVLEREIIDTTATLDAQDAKSYRNLMTPLAESWPEMAAELLAPLRFPKRPFRMARFGVYALRSAMSLAESAFRGERARGLFAGMAAHSFLPLETQATASFALILGILGHVTGWPVAAGGTAKIMEALAGYLSSLGGTVTTGTTVTEIGELPPEAIIFLDLTPRQVLKVAGERLEGPYRSRLAKYRYGPGVFKVDWALSGPIPWRAAGCRRTATIHLGGTLKEIAASERAVWKGEHPERPFVLVAQQTPFDPSRAPEGKHTGWAYCHVPNGSAVDMTQRIEAQVERFAPGFRDLILARHVRSAAAYEAYNANFVGGDINGGVQDLAQILARPVPGLRPYATTDPYIYLCSASTPPGGGVHGMCGYHAARCALESLKE
jgi:phytoene dehydrogenase-like protein